MDNNNTHTEKLVRYIDGELSEGEAEALRKELEKNIDMQHELDNLILVKAVIKNYGLTQKVSSIHHAMMNEMSTLKPTTKPVVRNLPKMIIRIAASIVILTALFSLYQYLTISPGSLYNDKYAAYKVATMRGITSTNVIEKAYSNKKYDDVIALYGRINNPSVSEKFLAAQAYLIKTDYNDAIIIFNAIIKTNNAANASSLNDDAEYYLALSYLKNKEIIKALPLLKKIHQDKNHLYNNKISSWYLMKVKLLGWKD